jgi:PAS domain S-box-containing protein
MDDKDKEIHKLKRRIAGLEKTIQIVAGHSGRMEKNLRQLFDVTSETIPVPLIIAQKTGQILFSNRKAQEIFNYSEKKFLGMNALALYETPDDRFAFMKMMTEDGDAKHFLVSMKKADGSYFPASISSRQILFEGQDCLLSVIHDLSDLKKAEEKRLSLERQLQMSQKMEAIGTLASGISHDFNNILAVIFGRLELSMLLLPAESPVRFHLEKALSAGSRAKSMVGQILAFCRREENERKPFYISVIIAEAAKMIRSLTPSNIELNLWIEARSAVVLGDPTQVHQVLMNLASNAIYVLKERGGAIDIRLDETIFDSHDKIMMGQTSGSPLLNPGKYVRLVVSDNGPGIDKEIRERIFDPFFTTKPPGEGTGMGLSIVHGIMQRHGGAITLESESGKGAAFHCYFPVMAETKTSQDMMRPVIAPKPFSSGSEKILLVDDEQEVLETCGKLLKNMGYHVTTRRTGLEALTLFKTDPDFFDLVITDNIMPKMMGGQMISEMRKIRPEIPVIVITGNVYTPDSDSNRAWVIQKPFTHDELKAGVQEVLSGNCVLP